MIGYIYCHISPSGKRYIGQTCSSLDKRWNNGYGYRNCPIFYSAIKKYGWENISHEVLETVEEENKEILIDELNKREAYWIGKYNTISPNGYNIESGGNGSGKRSAESLKKQSQTKLGGRTPTKKELQFYYSEQKKSIEEVSEILKISKGSISNWLTWYDIPKHNFGPQDVKIKSITKDELYNLYVIKNLTQQKIANLFGVSESTIGRRLKKYDIQSKPSHRYKEAI